MSKPARKLPVKKHINIKQDVASSKKKQNVKNIILLLMIALFIAIPFAMGKYCEFNSPDPYDSGGYVYSAKHVLSGAQIGVDEKPSAKVGTLLLNMLGVKLFGFNETGPKLIQTILQAIALLVMFYVMLQLYGILPATIGVFIASAYLSAPVIAKFGNVKEQYMIAFMILGISCFVIGQLKNKWIYILLAGAFVSWAPLFKETGLSAIAALGLFVIAQPLLKHVSWKKTGTDILLLFAGAIIFIAPVCLWLAIEKAPISYYPYAAFWRPAFKLVSGTQDNIEQSSDNDESLELVNSTEEKSPESGLFLKLMPSYVRDSWQIMNAQQIKEAKARVFRYYKVLILPIALAIGSIITLILRMLLKTRSETKENNPVTNGRFVLLFAIWWILDMLFVWISPRSYEQYYLPLNASAAMLSGYFIASYRDKLKYSGYKPQWIITGLVGFILMIIMSQHIFLGLSTIPHSGGSYPEKSNGYKQRLRDASAHKKGGRNAWEVVGTYIKDNSKEDDGIYVWGWFPGIYVAAQRLSPAPKAFESNMHTHSPKVLSERVSEILNSFKAKPPKFIVDTRKTHFPWDRPPLQLWPMSSNGFIPNEDPIIEAVDEVTEEKLRNDHGQDEALRYRAMAPFRKYVMKNYRIVGDIGNQVLFQLKDVSQD